MPKKTAEKLILKHDTSDPFEIAKQRGINILHEPLGNALGYYNSYKRIQFIHINLDINESLKNFVYAHELGHALLHKDANTPFLKKSTFYSVEKIEIEANTFAVELLMPDQYLYELKNTNLTVQDAAEMYGVPKEVCHLKKFTY